MKSYRSMMDSRAVLAPARPGGPPAHGPPARGPPARGPPAHGPPAHGPPHGPPARGRPDNLAPPRRGPDGGPGDEDDDSGIQETIDRLGRDIDEGVRARAFAGGGGGEDEDLDGGNDPKDDLMERAYYANMASSDT